MGRRATRCGLVALLGLVLSCSDADEGEAAPGDRRVREYSETYCAKVFACSCTQRPYASEDECSDKMYSTMRSRQLQARGYGWDYDDACLVERIESMTRSGCDDAVLEGESCGYYHGSKPHGELCGAIWPGMSECAQGLSCRTGLCFDPAASVHLAEGEACMTQTPEGMLALGFCAPDQQCHPETHVCVPIPELGESCWGSMLCNGGYCDEEACVPTRAEGDACSQPVQCWPHGYCDEESGVCTPLESLLCRGFMP